MSAANEVAVDAFLAGKTSFPTIAATVERVMDRHQVVREPGLSELLELDAWARREAASA
jgi:1-deoxy-D-xylulose-5-phosphate reductoisomerase